MKVLRTGPGAINRRSDHISAASLPQDELRVCVSSGPEESQWFVLRSCLIPRTERERERDPGYMTLSKLLLRDRAELFKRDLLSFVSFSTCHAASGRVRLHVCPLLRASSHLRTSKRCQHIESRARDKSTSLISVIECIQSAGTVGQPEEPVVFSATTAVLNNRAAHTSGA